MTIYRKWSLDQDASLTRHAAAGLLSYRYIGEAINTEFGTDYTRNATIGRAKRLGLLIANPRTHAPKAEKKPRVRKPAPPKPKPIDIPALRCVEIEPLNITLYELTDETCKWPYGDNPPYTFCGHPAFERAYCVHHFALSIGPGTSSERAAQRFAR